MANSDIELLCVSCKLGNNKRTNLLVVYRPPTGKLQSAIDILSDSTEEIRRSTSGEIVILGDFNVDMLPNNIQSRNLSMFATAARVSQIIKSPTRISNATSTLIDHIYTDMNNISDTGTLNYNLTDHLPVFVVKKKMRNSIKYKEILCRSYRNLDETQFRKDIESIDFFDIFTSNDPEIVYCHIYGIVEPYCPLRIMKIPLERPSYITDEIVQCMLQRGKAYKVARLTNDNTDWNIARSLRT